VETYCPKWSHLRFQNGSHLYRKGGAPCGAPMKAFKNKASKRLTNRSLVLKRVLMLRPPLLLPRPEKRHKWIITFRLALVLRCTLKMEPIKNSREAWYGLQRALFQTTVACFWAHCAARNGSDMKHYWPITGRIMVPRGIRNGPITLPIRDQ
jgi:hypothetical protein